MIKRARKFYVTGFQRRDVSVVSTASTVIQTGTHFTVI